MGLSESYSPGLYTSMSTRVNVQVSVTNKQDHTEYLEVPDAWLLLYLKPVPVSEVAELKANEVTVDSWLTNRPCHAAGDF